MTDSSPCRHGYLQELPSREYLPVLWSKEERALLQGTEAEHRAANDIELTQEDYETNVLPLLDLYPKRMPRHAFTLDVFRVAVSWVASRAFGVDSYHGKHHTSVTTSLLCIICVKLSTFYMFVA